MNWILFLICVGIGWLSHKLVSKAIRRIGRLRSLNKDLSQHDIWMEEQGFGTSLTHQLPDEKDICDTD